MVADLTGNVDRNGKTQAAIDAIDQGIHADDFSIDVAKGAAAIAGIDGGVGLNVFLIGLAGSKFVAALGADDSDRKRVGQIVGRTDGKSELPDPDGVAVG